MKLAIGLAIALACYLASYLAIASAEPQYMERRLDLTWYLPTGNRNYSGEWPASGSAACSWNFPIGTVFVLPQGHVYRCDDRGHLGSTGWLDAYVLTREEGQALAALYGDSVMARIFLPE